MLHMRLKLRPNLGESNRVASYVEVGSRFYKLSWFAVRKKDAHEDLLDITVQVKNPNAMSGL